ncbi:MAG: TetR/AcrR family transcriptional regulator [Gemmatimonadaceae bacterium]
MPTKDTDFPAGSAQPDTREAILGAAVEAYSKYGFRGATTRRIAELAGVNEVTLFRHFGSKDALVGEALRAMSPAEQVAPLPAEPRDLVVELTAWSEGQLAHLRDKRSMIRTCMGEIEERPELTQCAAAGPQGAFVELCGYLGRVRDAGMSFIDFDERVAAITLMGALFSDAMGREMMPEIYPPAEAAAREYTELILRVIGADDTTRSAFADATGAPRG